MSLSIEEIRSWQNNEDKTFTAEEIFSVAEFIYDISPKLFAEPPKTEDDMVHQVLMRSELINIYFSIYIQTQTKNNFKIGSEEYYKHSMIFDAEKKTDFLKIFFNFLAKDFDSKFIFDSRFIIDAIIKHLIAGTCTKEDCPIPRKVIRDYLVYECTNIEFLSSAIRYKAKKGIFSSEVPANELTKLLEVSYRKSRIIVGVDSFEKRINQRIDELNLKKFQKSNTNILPIQEGFTL